MKTIQLTRGAVAIIDDEDFIEVSKYQWCCDGLGYAKRSVRFMDGKKKSQSLHHFIMGFPPGVRIDHRDLNPLNNTRENLRPATPLQNSYNRPILTVAVWYPKLPSWNLDDIDDSLKFDDSAMREAMEKITTKDMARMLGVNITSTGATTGKLVTPSSVMTDPRIFTSSSSGPAKPPKLTREQLKAMLAEYEKEDPKPKVMELDQERVITL